VNAIAAIGVFNDVEVIPADTPLGVRLTFAVKLNPVLRQVVIQSLPTTPQGSVLPPTLISQIFSPQYGSILNTRQLQTGITRLNQWYRDNGYTLAQVIQPQIGNDGTVTLNVAEGVIEDIRVRFLNADNEPNNADGTPVTGRTRDFIITREVELKAGSVFNRRMAETDLQRLFGLGIFDDVRLSFNPGQDPRRVILVVDVVERNTGTITAGGGFSSSSGLFGSLGYQQQNLGGNNQRLGAELQIGQRELLFDIQFTDPWIAGDPYRTSYSVNAFRSSATSLIFDGGPRPVTFRNNEIPRILRYGIAVNFTRPLSNNVFARSEWVASVGFQYQNVSVRGPDNRVRARQAGNPLSASGTGIDDLVSFQAGIAQDTRDNPASPNRGSLLRLGVEQTVPLGSGSIAFNRLRANYSYYIPVRFTNFTEGPQTLAFNLQGGTIIGTLPPYEAFSMGGTNSVRGYNEGDVGSGRSYAQASAEYRFPIFNIIGGTLFVDAASDLGSGRSVPGNPAGVRGKPGSGIGYGVGIRVQSPVGSIRIDYGVNDRGNNRIHFGIGERF
jgi:outer membrane protein insertion porin family